MDSCYKYTSNGVGVEGKDYKVIWMIQRFPVLILSIHGGGIEPFTSEIARAIARADFHLYDFRGIRHKGNAQLHIPSTEFNDSRLQFLLGISLFAVSIHGMRGNELIIEVGGLNEVLANMIFQDLYIKGFPVRPPTGERAGKSPRNVVNRAYLKGVQLEISASLRRKMRDSRTTLNSFVGVVRNSIFAYYYSLVGHKPLPLVVVE